MTNQELSLTSRTSLQKMLYWIVSILFLAVLGAQLFSPKSSAESLAQAKEKYRVIQHSGELTCVKGVNVFGADVAYVRVSSQGEDVRLCHDMRDCTRAIRISDPEDRKLSDFTRIYSKNHPEYRACFEAFLGQSM